MHKLLEYPKGISLVTLKVNVDAPVITTSLPVKVPGEGEHVS